MAMASRARGGARRGVERRPVREDGDRGSGPRVARRPPADSGDVDRGGSRGGVAEIQRARMIAALVEICGERGVGGVTVAHIVARSGVSRRTFYELFEDREACFLAAFDQAIERAALLVVPAFGASDSWSERVRAGLEALLGYLEDMPHMGALCIVHALGAGPAVLERRERIVRVLIAVVDEGRGEFRGAARPARLTAEGVVGGVLAVLHARLSHDRVSGDGDGRSIATLLGPLMGMIVLPYKGPAAAAREAARPVPRRRRTARPHGDPLRELDMRLTYRTVRVLLAIAARPGASNRQVADASGVSDQGQISKLLARLQHLGLIDNSGAGPTRGEPNIWRLTPRGEEIERTIRPQATPAEA
jgi:AcrR family transcriptional regulator/DNA-binding MarR family transcriptional regulator